MKKHNNLSKAVITALIAVFAMTSCGGGEAETAKNTETYPEGTSNTESSENAETEPAATPEPKLTSQKLLTQARPRERQKPRPSLPRMITDFLHRGMFRAYSTELWTYRATFSFPNFYYRKTAVSGFSETTTRR